MLNKTIEEKCNFKTQRLSVNGWTSLIKKKEYENSIALKVI